MTARRDVVGDERGRDLLPRALVLVRTWHPGSLPSSRVLNADDEPRLTRSEGDKVIASPRLRNASVLPRAQSSQPCAAQYGRAWRFAHLIIIASRAVGTDLQLGCRCERRCAPCSNSRRTVQQRTPATVSLLLERDRCGSAPEWQGLRDSSSSHIITESEKVMKDRAHHQLTSSVMAGGAPI